MITDEGALVAVKWDLVQTPERVFDYFDRVARRVEIASARNLTLETMNLFYAPNFAKYGEGFAVYTKDFVGKSICVSVYVGGTGMISQLREVLGATDPKKAKTGTVRGDLCDDSLEKSIAQKRAVRNGAHVSESISEFFREFDIFRDLFSRETQELVDEMRSRR